MYHIFIFFSLIIFSPSIHFCMEPIAQVVDFAGTVRIQQKNRMPATTLQSAELPLKLFALDQLETLSGAFVHLVIKDQGDLFLEENSKILIAEPKPKKRFQFLVDLINGAVNCFVEKRGASFGIQTPVSVAGVLGTAFRVEVSVERTSIILVESKAGIEIQNRSQNLKTAYILRPSGMSGIHPVKLDLQTEPDSGTSDMMWAMSTKLQEDVPMRAIARANLLEQRLKEEIGAFMDEEEDLAFSEKDRADQDRGLAGSPPPPSEKESTLGLSETQKVTAKPSAAVVVEGKSARKRSPKKKMDYQEEMEKYAMPRYGKSKEPTLEFFEGEAPTFPIKNEFGRTIRVPFSEFKKWKTRQKN